MIILHPLYQQHDTKRNPWVVFYTHISQLMSHTTNLYVATAAAPSAAAYLAIMLIGLLAYSKG